MGLALYKQIFQRSKRSSQPDERMLWILYTRAWITNSILTVSQIIMKASGMGLYGEPDCVIGHPQVLSDAQE